MKSTIASFLAGAVVLGVSALVFFGGNHFAARGESRATREIEELRQVLHELVRGQESVAEKVRALEERLAADRAAARPLSEEEVADAVSRWLEAHPPAAKPAGTPEEGEGSSEAGASPAGDPSQGQVEGEVALERILDPATPRREKERAWQRLREEGLLDPAIEALKKRAAESPANPEVHSQLGKAYVQKISRAESDVEKGTLAMQADKAFDAALALDPNHWDARFTKAVTLSFWPPIFGKQAEAITQFETLLGQQEASLLRPEFAQTYLFLGNLYRGQGQGPRAAETWKKGLALFPEDKELAERLAGAEAK